MARSSPTVVGIDVGCKAKGFHAVAARGGVFVDKETDVDPAKIVGWCLGHGAIVVAVDAPCRWSKAGLSRHCERQLKLSGEKIHCFATPTRRRALEDRTGFYGWVLNGERLYQRLKTHFPLFEGVWRRRPVCFETFPHAVVCAFAGRVIPAKPKGRVRRRALEKRGYCVCGLPNVDYVDAALCAVTALEFLRCRYEPYGERTEGFIVVPPL